MKPQRLSQRPTVHTDTSQPKRSARSLPTASRVQSAKGSFNWSGQRPAIRRTAFASSRGERREEGGQGAGARLGPNARPPKEHWGHLRTTNPLESPFAALRLRTDAARRFKRVDSATALVWKMLMVAERRFRRLNAPELLKEVYEGVKFADGMRADTASREAAA